MAEGFTRHLRNETFEAYSAGVAPKGIDPRATEVMAEAGIDISTQHSNSIDDVKHLDFDYVITLCDNAHQSCPTFPGRTKVVHIGFEDPPKLAANARNEEEAKDHYRRVRDEIRAFVESLSDPLTQQTEQGTLDHQTQFQSGIKSFLGQVPADLVKKEGK
jgi:arsenate reductase